MSEQLADLFDQYCDQRGIGQPIDEDLLRSICDGNGDLLQSLRDQLLAAEKGAGLLEPLANVPVHSLHITDHEFNDITLIEPAGFGGYGCVYHGIQRVGNDSREIAVKFLPRGSLSQESFDRETHILKALGNARNIPKLHAAAEHAGYWYVAMDWIHGQSLETVIQNRKAITSLGQNRRRSKTPFCISEIALILKGILSPLVEANREYEKYLTSQGNVASSRSLIHGDLKPANVILRGGDVGDVWIVDFGVAQFKGEGIIGITDAYASPEMFTPSPLSDRRQLAQGSDVFQVACIGFELITGARYWECSDNERIEHTRTLLSLGPVGTTILRGLAWEPEKRFRSPEEFLSALRSATHMRYWLTRGLRTPFTWMFTTVVLLGILIPIERSRQTLKNEAASIASLKSELAKVPYSLSYDQKAQLTPEVYRTIRHHFLELQEPDGWKRLNDKDWRQYRRTDFSYLLDHRGGRSLEGIRNVLHWLDSVEQMEEAIQVKLRPNYMEEFFKWRPWNQKGGHRVVVDGKALIESDGLELYKKQSFQDADSIVIPWSIATNASIFLYGEDPATPVGQASVSEELTKRLVEVGLTQGMKFEIAAMGEGRKVVYDVEIVEGDIPRPPSLPTE